MLTYPNVMGDKATVRNGRQFGMSAERESLADYLRRVIRDKDLSYRKVAQRSGGRVSHATISDIINGRQKDVKTETLRGLAQGLDVPEEEIFAVARGAPVEYENPLDEVYVLFNGWAEASEEDRQETLVAIRMIAESFQRRKRRYTT